MAETLKKPIKITIQLVDDEVREYQFTVESETSWGLVLDGAFVEVKDITGPKFYFPSDAVIVKVMLP
jgi:hypothetical protein